MELFGQLFNLPHYTCIYFYLFLSILWNKLWKLVNIGKRAFNLKKNHKSMPWKSFMCLSFFKQLPTTEKKSEIMEVHELNVHHWLFCWVKVVVMQHLSTFTFRPPKKSGRLQNQCSDGFFFWVFFRLSFFFFQQENTWYIDEFQIDPVRALPHWNRGSLCQVTTPMRDRQ